MRLFYAAYLSRETMAAYQALVDRLIEQQPAVLRSVPRWTHHLTLAFLGEVEQTEVPKCVQLLDVADRFKAFSFSLAPPSILMGRGRPRLIRTGLSEGLARVQEVQTALIAGLHQHLPSVNDIRSKPPHVTLARFKKSARRGEARSVERALTQAAAPLPGTDRLASVCLIKSSLTPSGPVYETLRESFLAR